MSEKIETACPACQTKLRCSADKAGKRLRCPKCRAFVEVPALPKVRKSSGETADRNSDFPATEENAFFNTPEHPAEPGVGFDFERVFDGSKSNHQHEPDVASDNYHDLDTTEDEFADDDDELFQDDYDTEAPLPPRRTGRLFSELRDELVPRKLIPSGIKELVSDDEDWLFSGNPSKTVLYVRLVLAFLGGIAFNPPMIARISLEQNTTIISLLLFALAALWFLGSLYMAYVSWKSTYFAITSRQVISRTGWFSHRTRMAPTHNIQMVDIKSGIIDRWLGLNSVVFETAAAAGYGLLRTGVIHFASVHSDEVLTAFGRSMGKHKRNA